MTAVWRDLSERYRHNPKRVTRPTTPPPHTLPSDPRAGQPVASQSLAGQAITVPGKEALRTAQWRLWRRGRVTMQATINGVTVRIGAKSWRDSQGRRHHGAYITDGAVTNVGSLVTLWRWWHASYPALRAAQWTFAGYAMLDPKCWEMVMEAYQGVR